MQLAFNFLFEKVVTIEVVKSVKDEFNSLVEALKSEYEQYKEFLKLDEKDVETLTILRSGIIELKNELFELSKASGELLPVEYYMPSHPAFFIGKKVLGKIA